MASLGELHPWSHGGITRAEGTAGTEASSGCDRLCRDGSEDRNRGNRGSTSYGLVQWARSLWQGWGRSSRGEADSGGTVSNREEGGGEEVGVMSISFDSAAKFLCQQSGWDLSNLELQKLIYLAQVEHAEKYDGAPLQNGGFQAWDYGPVIPALYRRLKMFGHEPVADVLYNARALREGSPSEQTLLTTWEQFGGVKPGELIELTHWERGAWAGKYEPGIRHIPITQDDIIGEARARVRYSDEWRRIINT